VITDGNVPRNPIKKKTGCRINAVINAQVPTMPHNCNKKVVNAEELM
jgi:hypothetical protein